MAGSAWRVLHHRINVMSRRPRTMMGLFFAVVLGAFSRRGQTLRIRLWLPVSRCGNLCALGRGGCFLGPPGSAPLSRVIGSHFNHVFSHAHIQAHKHVYEQHTKGMATTRHRSLVGRGGRKGFVRDQGLAQKKLSAHRDIKSLKKMRRSY